MVGEGEDIGRLVDLAIDPIQLPDLLPVNTGDAHCEL